MQQLATTKLDETQMIWMENILKPPTVFVVVYCDFGSNKCWKTLSFTIDEYAEITNMKDYVLTRYPSAKFYKIYKDIYADQYKKANKQDEFFTIKLF